ncbi:ABC transporter ATP-binding protein [Actibacterium mucosum KCTC 23349]|uniref:ABC transporter ATP-binding protein n=1 Tax=Actibacterium mucosum KCTC 23349 TaxID=1454373 RepID=A0A037ZHD7_9RHOB|nr:ABC transporter ATP-binding protein [Actibacterium mucosum]KAJ54927.1 ABC transporter ATP-binding protein [Actibacterium mucosum KCTC 23349]
MIEIAAVSKKFSDGQRVLNGVSLKLAAGESLALMGDSGSGKSTFLNICAGLEPPDKGQVRIAGEDIAALSDTARATLRARRLGLVFLHFNLIPSLSVSDNLVFQARLAGQYDAAWTTDLAARLGLTNLLAQYPETLSGGQQQRVAIGRALAGRPGLILADEPTGNLDEGTSDNVMDLFLSLIRDTGAALLMVTHSPRMAAMLQSQAILRGGELIR